jgi:two-component system chemotaxis response regulator CheY
MKALIVEDDFSSRVLMQKILSPFGDCHVAVNGLEAMNAFNTAREQKSPYQLICLDIMMPELDGHEVLSQIREIEKGDGIFEGEGVKIIMTTALDDGKNMMQAFYKFCDAYLVKPIDKLKLIDHLRNLKLID